MSKEMACSHEEKLETNLRGHLIFKVYRESDKEAVEGTDTIFNVDSLSPADHTSCTYFQVTNTQIFQLQFHSGFIPLDTTVLKFTK